MRQTTRRLLLGATMLGAPVSATLVPARAADPDAQVASIEQKIRQLRAELNHVRADLHAHQDEVARARAVAEEARAEARAANARATAEAGGRTFGGTAPGGFYQPVPAGHAPGVFTAEDLPQNGLGPHGVQTAGEQAASALGQFGRFQLGGVSVQLGGYVEALAIVRTRNEVSDFATNFQSAPYPQSPLYHETEFRGTSRASRLSLLVEGKPGTAERVAAYFETDFGGAGTTSNSNETNSYALRIRQAYTTFDNADWGFHFLAGQAWSMLTVDRVGITPRQEALPLVPDGNTHLGFWYTRQWQLRFVKDFNKRVWVGLSIEAPETIYSVTTQTVGTTSSVGGIIGGTDNVSNSGGSLLNSTAQYADNIAPDIIGKLAFDPSFGHYEVFGLARFLNARETLTTQVNTGHNRTAVGGGGGAAMLLPILGPRLVFQAQGLVGQGIGRYGPGQLPDATVGTNGTPIPIPEVEAFVGLVAHPTKAWDLYAYVGAEQEAKRSFNERIGGVTYPFGFGNGRFIDTGCDTEGSTAACSGQTRGLVEGTLGAWWRFLHGPYGTLQVGTAWEYNRRTAFQGLSVSTVGGRSVGSPVTPKTDDNTILFSFRYLPFL